MLFDGLASVIATGANGDNSLRIAIITTVGVVAAALVTAAAQVIQQRRANSGVHRSPTQVILEDALRRAEDAEMHDETLQARIDYLESVCWRNGIDPDTGRKVIPGS